MSCQAVNSKQNLFFLADCAQSSPSPWQRVVLYRKTDTGSIIQNEKGENREFTYTLDTRTNELYKGGKYEDDDVFSIATKCALVALANPIFTGFYLLWNAIKTPVDIVRMSKSRIESLGRAWEEGQTISSLLGKVKIYTCEILKKTGQNVWNVVRAPLFGLGVQFTTLYGLVSPLEARMLEARVEHAWQHHTSWREDFRMMDTPESEGWWTAHFKDIQKAQCFYLAFCFQVKGNLKDPEFVFVRKEKNG